MIETRALHGKPNARIERSSDVSVHGDLSTLPVRIECLSHSSRSTMYYNTYRGPLGADARAQRATTETNRITRELVRKKTL